MSLYNAIHGFDPAAPVIMNILGVTPEDFPRFRDAYFDWHSETDNIPKIIILTRTGNRADYSDANEAITQLSGYMSDENDEFDSTFALWSFSVPQEYRERVVSYLKATGKPLSLREKTMRAVDMIGKGIEPIPESISNALQEIFKAIGES